MRAMWTGTITFGLVSIPVSIYTATDRESGPELNFVHAECGSKVSTRYACQECGGLFAQGELAKGHVHDAGMVTLTAEELAALDGTKSRTVEVLSFVDAGEVPTELYGSLYYVAPVAPKRARQNSPLPAPTTRAYQILVEALRRSGLVAVVSVSLRNREHRAFLSVSDDMLTMRVLLWPSQVRAPVFNTWNITDFAEYDGRWPVEELSDAVIDMNMPLVEALRGKFDPAEHADPYAARLVELVETKVIALAAPEPAPPADNVTPLFAGLALAMSKAGA